MFSLTVSPIIGEGDSSLLSSALVGRTATGIDDANVTSWMVAHVGAVAPLDFELIAGGRSNLTFRVTDASGRRFALRRPPTSHVLPTAHDMVREHTIISALLPMGVPVAQPLALCVDDRVNERPFYVMEFVDGAILRDRQQAESAFDEETRRRIGDNLAATLARLHDVDVVEAGLDGLARHDGYVERQLRRWRTQYDQMRTESDDHSGIVEAVGDQLAASIPIQQRVTVVHGDYRLDNVVLDGDGSVRAILDWEISTLGDPMADVGLLLVYWAEPSDRTSFPLGDAPTTASGFATRHQVLEAYARHTSLDVSHVAYYQAFGYWKLACILQGVYARYRAGATAGDQGSVSEFPTHIAVLAEMAKQTLEYD
jgi:aminoglycoside phosphotransferase (APT) family kinase protein